MMHVVRTARLTLEPQVAAHADEMFRVLGDPAIYTYENAPPRSVEWLRERFTRLEARTSPDGREQWLNWVLRLGETRQIPAMAHALTPDAPQTANHGQRRSEDSQPHWLHSAELRDPHQTFTALPSSESELIGYVQATVQSNGSAMIGYELASRHWGRGFGSEAVAAMISHLWTHCDVDIALAVLKQANQRSLRLLDRLGFGQARAEDFPDVHVENDEFFLCRRLGEAR